MTNFDESDLRHKNYREYRRAYIAAIETCKSMTWKVKFVLDQLEKPRPAPTSTPQSAITPQPKPVTNKTKQFPTEAQVEDALTTRDAARQNLTDAWNAMTKAEQSESLAPPEGLFLRIKND